MTDLDALFRRCRAVSGWKVGLVQHRISQRSSAAKIAVAVARTRI